MTHDEVWQNEFGQKETATDFAGRPVRRGDYGKKQSPTGWDYDHIEPLNPNGNEKHKKQYNNIANVQIANIATNREKANKTSFSIHDTQYQVVRNTPKKINGKHLAPYNYKEKNYCIVILDK
jgi:hypothetical protein